MNSTEDHLFSFTMNRPNITNIFTPTARKQVEYKFDPNWEIFLKEPNLPEEYEVAATVFSHGKKSSAYLRYTYVKYEELWRDQNSAEYDAMVEQGQQIIEEEFSSSTDKERVPTIKDLVDVILNRYKYNEENQEYFVKYKQGDWVEIMDVDMEWRLNQVKEIKVYDVDGDGDAGDEEWEVGYDVGGLKNLTSDEIRCSEAGLKVLFGIRPWVWQQYAMLKIEERIRFQRDHADDFVNFPIVDTTKELWEVWLDNPDNADFKELYNHPSIGESGRRSLVAHIMKPFELMAMLAEGQDGWDVTDDDVLDEFGAFTYLSL